MKARIAMMGSGAGGKILKAGGAFEYLGQTDVSAWRTVAKAGIHGLLLLGGGDVNPKLYTDETHGRVYGVNDARDEAEWYALEEARTRGIPVMGICRGAQMMNVHAGGTLHIDIQSLPQTHKWHQGSDARVQAVKGSRLAKAWRSGEQWAVHIHHQAVKDLAPGYVATAFAHDGIIEAHESVDGWELGVQFHPEMDNENPAHQRIFDRFVMAAGRMHGIEVTPQPWVEPKRPTFAEAYVASRPQKAKVRKAIAPITRSWACGQCNVRFDEKIDFEDHMVYLHGQMREVFA